VAVFYLAPGLAGWVGDGEDRRESREDPRLGWTGGCSASGRVGGLGG
jgi:hypothetical protein